MVNACKAAGIQPIDSVFSDVDDRQGLFETASKSKALGFEGMGVIHPRQINVIYEAFRPSEQEIEKARKIVQAFKEAEEKGANLCIFGHTHIPYLEVGTERISISEVLRVEEVYKLLACLEDNFIKQKNILELAVFCF